IAISDELDKDTTGFNTPLLRPRVIGEWIGREENDADPLAAEMLQPPIPRNKNEQWDSEDSSSPGGSLKMEPKTKGLKQQQQQHKKLLAAMLSQDSFDSAQSTAPSVTEEDIDNEDDAMELLEDLDDLRMEGVTSVVSSGSKFNQTRSAHMAEPQAKVTLNICARCARLQGDNLAERPEDVSMVSQTSEPAVTDSDESIPGHLNSIIYTSNLLEETLTPKGYKSFGRDTFMHLPYPLICLWQDEFLQQLQLAHQPWTLPSDTESEGMEADQDK
ncbi:Uncharacterized protein C8orf34, partial [Tauraco erythrolophus]